MTINNLNGVVMVRYADCYSNGPDFESRVSHSPFQQGPTGHSSKAMLLAGAFTISHTKCLKRGLLKEFRQPFGFFCMECRKGLIHCRGLYAELQKASTYSHTWLSLSPHIMRPISRIVVQLAY
jgi:hypothetical protein